VAHSGGPTNEDKDCRRHIVGSREPQFPRRGRDFAVLAFGQVSGASTAVYPTVAAFPIFARDGLAGSGGGRRLYGRQGGQGWCPQPGATGPAVEECPAAAEGT